MCCYMTIIVWDIVAVFSWQGEASSVPCYWMRPEVWTEENFEGSFKVLLFVTWFCSKNSVIYSLLSY